MKKTYAYIILSSLLLFNAILRSFPRQSEMLGAFAVSKSVPSLSLTPEKPDSPDFLSLFVSASAAAYEGKKKSLRLL